MIAAGLQLVRRLGPINWALADQVVVSGGNFLTTLLLARSLGVEEFGRLPSPGWWSSSPATCSRP